MDVDSEGVWTSDDEDGFTSEDDSQPLQSPSFRAIPKSPIQFIDEDSPTKATESSKPEDLNNNPHESKCEDESESQPSLNSCKICQKVCKTKTALIQHEKSHTNAQRVCHQCGKVFVTDQTGNAGSRLSNHLAKCEGGWLKDPVNFTCEKCHKEFANKRNLQRHQPDCSPVCKNCDKTFKTMKGFGLHLCPRAPMLQ